MTKRLAAVFLCGALAGCGTSGYSGGPLRVPLTPAYNRHAARVDARYLLGLLVLPTGAIRSSGAPPSSLRRPAEGPAVTPNIVDLHRWWRVKGSPTQM